MGPHRHSPPASARRTRLEGPGPAHAACGRGVACMVWETCLVPGAVRQAFAGTSPVGRVLAVSMLSYPIIPITARMFAHAAYERAGDRLGVS